MPRALFIALLLAAAPAALAQDDPCATLGPEADLPALATALEAYAQLDPELFASSLAQAELGLGCLDPTLTPEWEAQLWLARGLDGWLRRDKAALVEAFDRLVAVDPDIRPGPSLVPAGSALEKALAAARAKRALAAAHPVASSSVVEVTPSPDESSPIDPGPVAGVRLAHASWALLGTGLAAGALAGGAAWVSGSAEERFWSADLRDDAQRAYATNRAAGFTAYGVAGVSVGLVVSAAVVGRW